MEPVRILDSLVIVDPQSESHVVTVGYDPALEMLVGRALRASGSRAERPKSVGVFATRNEQRHRGVYPIFRSSSLQLNGLFVWLQSYQRLRVVP
jgi:hypothetical protein